MQEEQWTRRDPVSQALNIRAYAYGILLCDDHFLLRESWSRKESDHPFLIGYRWMRCYASTYLIGRRNDSMKIFIFLLRNLHSFSSSSSFKVLKTKWMNLEWCFIENCWVRIIIMFVLLWRNYWGWNLQFFSTRLIHKGSFENIIIGVEKSGVEFKRRFKLYWIVSLVLFRKEINSCIYMK